MAWLLYAGGVSLILPDVRFGTVSQDWVTVILWCADLALESQDMYTLSCVLILEVYRYTDRY